MLPFLKKKPQVAGIITKVREPDSDKPQDSEEDQGLRACARDLIDAVHSQDEGRVASAIRAAFAICDSEPHEEGEHTNESPEPHSYDAQNIK